MKTLYENKNINNYWNFWYRENETKSIVKSFVWEKIN